MVSISNPYIHVATSYVFELCTFHKLILEHCISCDYEYNVGDKKVMCTTLLYYNKISSNIGLCSDEL